MDSGNPAPPFLSKTYDMVDDPSTDSVVSWSSGNNSFVIWNLPDFQRDLLPKFFKHNNYSSFVRQLNTYGFRKVVQDRHEFANEDFLRGQKHLLKNISRKKPAHAHANQPAHAHANQPAQAQSSPVAACVEVGKFGFDEEIEMLKRDKNVLMQELVRLRQQHQTTDHQLHSMGQRVQVMEQRQQQMMSFLAKAMQSPGFLSQLVHQQNETSQRVVGGTKKRRLPRQEEEDLAGDSGNNVANGQIVKFHSSMNEAAKAMLQQIMKMNSSARLDPSMTDLVPFLIGDVPSSSALDSGNSTSRISGLTLSEVSPASTQPFLPIESGVPVSDPSAAFSEVQSAPCAVADPIKASHINEINVLSCEQDPVLSNFNEMQGVGPENSLGSLNIDMATFENGNDRVSSGLNVTIPVEMDVFSPNSGLDLTIPVELDPFSTNSGLNVTIPVEMDASSPKHDVEVFVDAIPKLPSINDVFWEQFLTAGPLTEETDGFNSSSPESDITNGNQSWKENGWDKLQHMNKLAEQMELLASETL